MSRPGLIGCICGMLTGFCWGLAGVFSQYLFTNTEMVSGWFVAIRMIVSGICLLGFALFQNHDEITSLLKCRKDCLLCIMTGIIGTMLFQMTCYGAVQRSNAATAIVLQYLCPVMVMLYVCIRDRRLPEKKGVISLVLAVGGIFLISTHANIHTLIITKEALIWGVGCAFFMMLCTILPERLYEKYSVQTITAVSLASGGIMACIIEKPFQKVPEMDFVAIMALFAAIGVGCLLAYVFYGQAVKAIGSAKASLYACAEIPTATILSVVFLGSSFMYLDIIGFVMIASTIFILSMEKKESEDKK